MPLSCVSSFPLVCLFIHSCAGQALTLFRFEKLMTCTPGRSADAFNTSFHVKMGNPFIFATVLRSSFLHKRFIKWCVAYWSGASQVAQLYRGQCRRWWLDLWVRMIPRRRKWQLIPVFLPGKFREQRSLAGYSSQGCRVRHDWATEKQRANFEYASSSPAPLIKIYIYKPKLGENSFHNIYKTLVFTMLLKELWTWKQPCFLTLSPHSVAENLFYTRLEDFRRSTKYCLWVSQL